MSRQLVIGTLKDGSEYRKICSTKTEAMEIAAQLKKDGATKVEVQLTSD